MCNITVSKALPRSDWFVQYAGACVWCAASSSKEEQIGIERILHLANRQSSFTLGIIAVK